MGLDVCFKVQISTFEFRNVSESDGLSGLKMPRFIFSQEKEDQEKAWITTWTSMDLLSLGKASGIRDFLQETLGSYTFANDDWADGVINIPKDKVLGNLAQLYVDCINKTKRTEWYPWLDCHGNLSEVKEWIERFIIIPDTYLRRYYDGHVELNPEGLHMVDGVRFRNTEWQEILDSGMIRFQWQISV